MANADSNKVVVVTGGSRGIGRATCLLLATRGFKVVIGYGNRPEAANAVKQVIGSTAGQAICVKADLNNEEDIVGLFEAAGKFGELWGLVNSAGIVEADCRVDAMSASRLQKVFGTNVIGTFLCCREAIRRMSTKYGGKGGSIVNLSSMNSVYGGGGRAVDYGASKGAIDTLTIGLAREVAQEGVRVNCVRPAAVRTDLLRLDENPERLDAISRNLPMGRIGEPSELARAIVFLLSEDSSFTTGAILNVSGGR